MMCAVYQREHLECLRKTVLFFLGGNRPLSVLLWLVGFGRLVQALSSGFTNPGSQHRPLCAIRYTASRLIQVMTRPQAIGADVVPPSDEGLRLYIVKEEHRQTEFLLYIRYPCFNILTCHR